jgi:tetratricopeptide (TPR) repeat protein
MITLTKQELEVYFQKNMNSPVFAHLALLELDEDPDHALAICDAHIQNHPEYGFGYFVKGYILYKKEDYTSALENLELATLLNPSLVKAWELKQAIYSQLGEDQGLKLTNMFISVWQDTQEIKEEISFGDTELLEEVEDMTSEVSELDLEDELISEDELLGELEETVNMEEEIGDLEAESTEIETGTEPKIETPEIIQPEIPIEEENRIETGDNAVDEMEKVEELESLENQDAIEDLDFTNPETEDELDELLDKLPEVPAETETAESGEVDSKQSEPQDEQDMKEKIEEEIKSEFEGNLLQEEKMVDMETNTSEVNKNQVKKEISESLGDFEINTADEADLGIARSDMEGNTKVVTSTLGEIYIAQGKFKEALEVFRTLLEENPENRRYKRKVKELQELLQQNK